MTWRIGGMLALVLSAGVLLARFAIDQDSSTAVWDANRASGFAGYLLLWAAVVGGIALHMRIRPAWLGASVLLELHRVLSVLAGAFVTVHVVATLADAYVDFPPVVALVPFTSEWNRVAVGFGTLAEWGLVAVLASTAMAGRMAVRTWRWLHMASFPAFILALLHGVLAGSDTNASPAIAVYAVTSASVAFLLVLRIYGRDWAEGEGAPAHTAVVRGVPAGTRPATRD